MGVKTNNGIEFTKKKMGLRAMGYQISEKKEKKKMGVMTNHGIEFTKKNGFERNGVLDDEPWQVVHVYS